MNQILKTKRCRKCGKIKPVSEFYKSKKGRLGSWCKQCDKEYQKEYQKEYRKLYKKFQV
ncbi:hypothetical protein ES703_88836 [subsurface metagenome]